MRASRGEIKIEEILQEVLKKINSLLLNMAFTILNKKKIREKRERILR